MARASQPGYPIGRSVRREAEMTVFTPLSFGRYNARETSFAFYHVLKVGTTENTVNAANAWKGLEKKDEPSLVSRKSTADRRIFARYLGSCVANLPLATSGLDICPLWT